MSAATRQAGPATLVYVLMMGLTLATWQIGRAGLSGEWVAPLVLTLALFKGHLVGDWFMGLRRVTGPWRWVLVAWLLIIGTLILTAFLLANGE